MARSHAPMNEIAMPLSVDPLTRNIGATITGVDLNDELDRALYKHFGIIGPPSIMFFDTAGNERRQYRVVGFMNAEHFAPHTRRALQR